MPVALTSGWDQGGGGDWTNAAWHTWAAQGGRALCLPLEGWPERHTKQFEHSMPMYSRGRGCLNEFHLAVIQAWGALAADHAFFSNMRCIQCSNDLLQQKDHADNFEKGSTRHGSAKIQMLRPLLSTMM